MGARWKGEKEQQNRLGNWNSLSNPPLPLRPPQKKKTIANECFNERWKQNPKTACTVNYMTLNSFFGTSSRCDNYWQTTEFEKTIADIYLHLKRHFPFLTILDLWPFCRTKFHAKSQQLLHKHRLVKAMTKLISNIMAFTSLMMTVFSTRIIVDDWLNSWNHSNAKADCTNRYVPECCRIYTFRLIIP